MYVLYRHHVAIVFASSVLFESGLRCCSVSLVTTSFVASTFSQILWQCFKLQGWDGVAYGKHRQQNEYGILIEKTQEETDRLDDRGIDGE